MSLLKIFKRIRVSKIRALLRTIPEKIIQIGSAFGLVALCILLACRKFVTSENIPTIGQLKPFKPF